MTDADSTGSLPEAVTGAVTHTAGHSGGEGNTNYRQEATCYPKY